MRDLMHRAQHRAENTVLRTSLGRIDTNSAHTIHTIVLRFHGTNEYAQFNPTCQSCSMCIVVAQLRNAHTANHCLPLL